MPRNSPPEQLGGRPMTHAEAWAVVIGLAIAMGVAIGAVAGLVLR